MKSDRRHELQQNELARWLGQVFAAVKPYGTGILALLLLASLLAAGITLWSRTSASQAGTEWNSYFSLLHNGRASVSAFENLATNASSNVKYWATMTASDRQLARACDLLFSNKDLAEEELKTAAEGYTKLLAAPPQAVRERATLGLARTQEALGDIDEAVKTYESLQTQWPKGAFAEEAAGRLSALKSGTARTFFDRFAKSVARPPATESNEKLISPEQLQFPSEGKTRSTPFSLRPVEDGRLNQPESKLVIPPTWPEEAPPAKPAESKPAATKPAAKPASEKPAVETPPAAKSAAEKPVVEKAAAAKPADAKK